MYRKKDFQTTTDVFTTVIYYNKKTGLKIPKKMFEEYIGILK